MAVLAGVLDPLEAGVLYFKLMGFSTALAVVLG